MPSTAVQDRALKQEIEKARPAVDAARQKSDALGAEAAALRQRLIAAAARVQQFEQQKIGLDAAVAQLGARSAALSTDLDRRRGEVSRLLAVLERMQHDNPPVMALKADDALAAAHATMLLGATLPRVYGAATALVRQIEVLKRTRADLVRRRAEDAVAAGNLAKTRGQLDQLLATKAREADSARAAYGDLAARLSAVANQAADLDTLLRRVAALRGEASGAPQVVVVAARNARRSRGLRRDALLRPVVGRMMPGDGEPDGSPRAPGVSFLAPPAAEVVAPADSQVLFAGAYHKAGLVLILHSLGGYDLVLAGLERIDVRTGDELLAGEPVGKMPRGGTQSRLYFELRQNGKGASPAPWLSGEPGKVM
jgi:septal ring factor EnvC (AmiA/AmiB activator)